jgi:type I restriction enzyme S subunit
MHLFGKSWGGWGMSSEALHAPIECPSEWHLTRLKAIATKIGSGATPTGGLAAYQPERTNFALVRSQNVLDREFAYGGLAFISDEQAVGLRGVVLQPDDILLNITGDGITFGRACLVPRTVLPACVNQHVAIVRLDRCRAHPGYVLGYLTHPTVKEYIESFNAGGSRRAITKAHIESFVVPLPPLHIQVAVGELLAAFDDRITLLRETNTTLEAIAQALFKSWFVDFDPVRAKMEGRVPDGMDEATAALFPDGFEPSELGVVPRGWPVGRLEDLLVLQRGFDLPSQDRTPGDFPIIAASGPSGTHHEAMVKGPGVVTGRSGVLGKVFLELEDFWPLNTTLWVKDFRAATPCYAYEVLRLLDFKSFNAGSAVPTLNRNHIHGLPYVLPDRCCMEVFESIALMLHQRCKENEKQAQALISLQETLLPRLISGHLRLPMEQEAN